MFFINHPRSGVLYIHVFCFKKTIFIDKHGFFLRIVRFWKRSVERGRTLGTGRGAVGSYRPCGGTGGIISSVLGGTTAKGRQIVSVRRGSAESYTVCICGTVSHYGRLRRKPDAEEAAWFTLYTKPVVYMFMLAYPKSDSWTFEKNVPGLYVHVLQSTTRYWSSGGTVVNILACGARGLRFDSPSRRFDIRDWLSPASKSRHCWNIAIKAT